MRTKITCLTTRIYQPTKAVLDGTYKLPPVTRVE